MQTTSLSTLISRMDRWKTISDIDEPSKIKDLDSAIRIYKRKYKFPWHLRKASLRVFSDILEYPIEADHNSLAFIENSESSENKFNGVYTSIKQFYENPDDRNDLCEIWKDGNKSLGVRNEVNNGNSIRLDDGSDSDFYSYSGDVVSIAEDDVIFKTGYRSIRAEIVNNTNSSFITISPTAISDSLYKRKYLFIDIFLESIPTDILMKIGSDSSNYLQSLVTTQFSGESFKVGQWNTIAIDLNTASIIGVIDYNSIDYINLEISDLDSGYLYIDSSYLREWTLKDYWYYSIYSVKSSTSSFADKEYFMNNDVYEVGDCIIGDSEFADLIMYEAMLIGINEKENAAIFAQIQGLRDDAFNSVVEKNPSLDPIIEETYYNF